MTKDGESWFEIENQVGSLQLANFSNRKWDKLNIPFHYFSNFQIFTSLQLQGKSIKCGDFLHHLRSVSFYWNYFSMNHFFALVAFLVYVLCIVQRILSCSTHGTQNNNKLKRGCLVNIVCSDKKWTTTTTQKRILKLLRRTRSSNYTFRNFYFQFIHYDKKIINFRHSISATSHCANVFFMCPFRAECSFSLCFRFSKVRCYRPSDDSSRNVHVFCDLVRCRCTMCTLFYWCHFPSPY